MIILLFFISFFFHFAFRISEMPFRPPAGERKLSNMAAGETFIGTQIYPFYTGNVITDKVHSLNVPKTRRPSETQK